MTQILPPWPLLSTFLLASAVLAAIPGPGVFYIVARSLARGRRHGLASVAGVAVGNLANAVGASAGLAALFALSAPAFTVVKYAGALYLVYLGVQALRTSAADRRPSNPEPMGMRRIFLDGLIVALLNPKTAIFFAAFLPQFLNADSMPMLQSAVLGVFFVSIAAVTDTAYALSAGVMAAVVTRTPAIRTFARYLTRSVLIGLGAFAALAGVRDPA